MRFLMFVVAAALAAASGSARAELRLCNQTEYVVVAAVGQARGAVAVSEGWWVLYPGSCQIPIGRPLEPTGLHLHAYALRPDPGGGRQIWGGSVPFCVADDRFRFMDGPPCPNTAFPLGFTPLNTGGARSWTFDLTGPGGWSNLDEARIAGVQRLLNLSGYDAGTVDGLAGPNTLRAIRAFQRSAGLGGQVRLNAALLQALNQAAPRAAARIMPQ